MKTASASRRLSKNEAGVRRSRGSEDSRSAREKAELAMTSAERLTLALELSDLCAELGDAGRRAMKERS